MSSSEPIHIELDEAAVELLNQLKGKYASRLLSRAVDAARGGPYEITAEDIRRIAESDEVAAESVGKTASGHNFTSMTDERFRILRILLVLGLAVLIGSGVALGAVLIPSVVHDNVSRILIGVAMLGAAVALIGATSLILSRYGVSRHGVQPENLAATSLATWPNASPAGSFAAANENLRTATRWLLIAAVAAGMVIVVGVPFTNIGFLSLSDWPRLMAAGIGLAAAVGAVGYIILRASGLLADERITLAQLELDEFTRQLRNSSHRRDRRRGLAIDRIYEELQSYQDELYGSVAVSISDLYSRLIKANDAARKSPDPEHMKTAADLRNAVDTLVQAANYSYTRTGFAALRTHLAQAGAVFVAGVVVFAYAANPPKPTNPGASQVSIAIGIGYRPEIPVPKPSSGGLFSGNGQGNS